MKPAHSLKGQHREVGKVAITRHNVGRIAERIVANELEARGFRVSDLNKEGIAPNADLVAILDGHPLQIQVKGATNDTQESWVTYGYCTEQIIDRKAPMFNRKEHGFYEADFVVLVAVRSPAIYRCFVLPTDQAEKAAQWHLDGGYRAKKWKPGKTHLTLEPGPRAKRNAKVKEGRQLVKRYEGDKGWEQLAKAVVR